MVVTNLFSYGSKRFVCFGLRAMNNDYIYMPRFIILSFDTNDTLGGA